MAKKRMIIGTLAAAGIAAALVVGAAFAGRESIEETRDRVVTILKGSLSPGQFQTLMDFHQDHRAERDEWAGRHLDPADPADPVKLWRELGLTEDQQDGLLDVVAGHIDELAPKLAAVQAAGAGVKDAALAGDPASQELSARSRELGGRIADSAVVVAGMVTEARAALTPEQVKLLETRRAETEKFELEQLNRLPERALELAELWEKLDLSTSQVDALEEIHGIIPDLMRERHQAEAKEFREELAGILDREQLAAADLFRDAHRDDAREHRRTRREAHERLRAELDLSGEQKIAIVETLIKHRDDLVQAMMLLAGAGMDLRAKVLAGSPDETAIRLASDQLGETIGLTAAVAAGLVAEIKGILTPAQFAAIAKAGREHDEMAAKHLAEVPARVHGVIRFLDELALTPAQKDAIVSLIEQKREERRAAFNAGRGDL